MPDAPNLNRTVDALQLKPSTQDAYGAAQETWQRCATFWAEVTAKSGQHVTEAQANKTAAYVSYRIRTRYRTDIEAKSTRLLVREGNGGMTLRVNAVYDPDGRRTWTEILATEVVA